MNTTPEYFHSELPAIELFKKLKYQYDDGELIDERDDITEVILKDRLLNAIKRINKQMNGKSAITIYKRHTMNRRTFTQHP